MCKIRLLNIIVSLKVNESPEFRSLGRGDCVKNTDCHSFVAKVVSSVFWNVDRGQGVLPDVLRVFFRKIPFVLFDVKNFDFCCCVSENVYKKKDFNLRVTS